MSAVEAMKSTDVSTGSGTAGAVNAQGWETVCQLNDIAPDTGVCVLFNGQQVAVFRERTQDRVYAISNYDPIGEASVLSRGIVGSVGDELVVASPLYKQHFSLTTGQCVEDDSVSVKTFSVRVENGDIQLSECT